MNRVLILDYDGVIVDSLEVNMKIFNEIFYKYNLKAINSKREFVKLYDDNFYVSIIKLGVPKEKIPKILKKIKSNTIKYQDDIQLFDKVKETLRKLSNYNTIVIISSCITEVIKRYLKSKDIDFIHEIIGADKETSKIKKILYIKKKYSDSDIYYVSDTKGDIIEGKKSGVKTIAVTWGWHSREKLEKENPDYIVDDPKELLTLFKNR